MDICTIGWIIAGVAILIIMLLVLLKAGDSDDHN